MTGFIVILSPLYVCWDMNILPFAFLENFIGRCSVDINQNITRKHFETIKVMDYQLLQMIDVMV